MSKPARRYHRRWWRWEWGYEYWRAGEGGGPRNTLVVTFGKNSMRRGGR